MGIVIKKTISTSIINYLGVMLGVVNILWLQTAILSELQIGILSYIFDVAILLFPFIMFGTSGLPARFIHLFKPGLEQNSFISLLFIVPIMILIVVGIFFIVFKENIISILGDDAIRYKEYLVYILPIIFCYIFQYLLEAMLATKSLTVFTSFFKNIYRRLFFIVLLILYHYEVFSFFNMILWFVVGHLIEVCILFFYFQKVFDFKASKPKIITDKTQRKEIFQYAFYLLIGVSGVIMVGKIDSIMISGITDDFRQLGIYTIAFFIATVIELPKRIVHQLVFPIMSKKVTENKQDELNEMYKQTGINMSIIGLFLFLVIWYNIDELFLIIPNGDIYQAGKWAVFFVGLAKVIDVVFGTTDLIINATKHFKWNGFLIPILISLTFCTNYFFISEFGIVGAAGATGITIFVYSIIKYYLVFSKLKMNLLSKEHILISLIALIIVVIFYFKPVLSNNSILEIIINTSIITLVFIGGNYLLKSSKEINTIIDGVLKKIKSFF